MVSFLQSYEHSAMAAERRGVINAARGGHQCLIFDISWKIFPGLPLESLVLKHLSQLRDDRQQCVLQQQCLFLLKPILGIFHALSHKEMISLMILNLKSSREECFS